MYSINWETFFDNHHDNNLGNQDSTVLSDAWSQTTSQIEKKAFISNDDSIVILTANANNTVTILLSFKNIGGTTFRPIDKFVCFFGANEHATVVNITMPSITASIKFTTPSIDDILVCNSAAEITSLPAPAINAPANFHGCRSFLPAPWLLSTILEANSNDPIKLIVECHQAAILFDQFHFGNPLFIS